MAIGTTTALALAAGGAALGGGSYLSGRSQNAAAENAADAQVQAAQIAADAQLEGSQEAMAFLEEQYRNNVNLNLSRAQSGDAALAEMMSMVGLEVPQSLTSGDAYEEILYGRSFGEGEVGPSLYGQQVGGSGAGTNALAPGGDFDPNLYLEQNPDVLQRYEETADDARRNHGITTPQEFARFHWESSGQDEGRAFPSAIGQEFGPSSQYFDPSEYLANNPDVARYWENNTGNVQSVYGSPEEWARNHYEQSGRSEGREFALDDTFENELARTYGEGTTYSAPGDDLNFGQDLSIGAPTQTDITQTPGYQFRFDEGIRALDSSAASSGRILSGAQIRRVNDFGQDLAGEEFNNQYNRLASIAGVGQTATQTISGNTQQLGSQGAGLITSGSSAVAGGALGAGNARASSYYNQTNPIGNSLATVGGAAIGIAGRMI